MTNENQKPEATNPDAQSGVSSASLLGVMESLGTRFHGTDLQFRRSGTSWPCRWRARLLSTKNEREEYRITAFGDTAAEAILKLQIMVNKLDA